MSEQDQETELPANQGTVVEYGPTEQLEGGADALSAFNSVLWEIAKTFAIITVILLMVFFLFITYLVAEWGLTML